MGQAGTKELSSLGTRMAFNKTLRHLVSVTNIVDAVDKGTNLADLLNKMQEAESIQQGQLAPILYLVLVEKFKFPFISMNISESVTNFDKIIEIFTKWNAVEMVVAYHHPNFGLITINPAQAGHWDIAQDLKREELLVVYARTKDKREDSALKAIESFQLLLQGKDIEDQPAFIDVKKEAPAPAPAAPTAAR